MSEEATQIEEEIPEEELETSPGVSRNEAAREALYAAREAEDGEDTEPSFEEPEPEEIEGDVEEEPKVEMMMLLDDSGNEYQVPKTAKLKLKIDGEEEERTLDATIRNYQKGAAGDKKLQEASQQLRLIEEKSGELTRREQAFQQTVEKASQKHADGNLSNDDFEAIIARAVTALVDADEDTAKEELLKAFKPPTPQKVELSDEELDARLRRREQAQAVKWFDKEYKELSTNPVYRNMVDKQTIDIMAEDPDMLPKDVLRKAAKAVEEAIEEEKTNDLRGRLGEAGLSKTEIENIISGKPSKPKTQKKSVPTPTGGRVPSDQGEKIETRADVMNEYRRQRHQPI